MMHYQISPTPANYSLWYTYVSNEIPALNIELDNLLEKHKICPAIQSEVLYRKFIATSKEVTTWNLRKSIEEMLIQLDQSLADTQTDTTVFQKTCDDTFTQIKSADKDNWPLESVMNLLKKVENNALTMHKSAAFFTENLATAKNEIVTLKKQLKESQKEALYDSLTGLLNRHAFDTELSNYLQTISEGLCMILGDIDNFKSFNDKWGHLVGDQILKAVGMKFNNEMKDGAIAYRFGGEEFAVLLPCSNFKFARLLAEKLRYSIEKLSLKDKRTGSRIDNITLSFGISELKADEPLGQFVERADKNLYKAKRLGRNRVLPLQPE